MLCEKPLCKTVEEALKVEEAVHKSGKILQNLHIRSQPADITNLKNFIDEGDLGDIYFAKATCLRRLGNPGGWFSDSCQRG